MDADHRRSRKRRRVETPEDVQERPAATATTAAKEMATVPVVSLTLDTSHFVNLVLY